MSVMRPDKIEKLKIALSFSSDLIESVDVVNDVSAMAHKICAVISDRARAKISTEVREYVAGHLDMDVETYFEFIEYIKESEAGRNLLDTFRAKKRILG